MEDFFDFWVALTADLPAFSIGLMPFDAVDLRFGHHGLSIPGIGLRMYKNQAKSLFTLLRRLVPRDYHDIGVHIDATIREGSDGFWLLWRLAFFTIGIFDRSKALPKPRWPDDDNIFTFLLRVKLHNVLLGHRGRPLSARELSQKFLDSIDHTLYYESDRSLGAQLASIPGRWTEYGASVNNLPDDFNIDNLARKLGHRVIHHRSHLTPPRANYLTTGGSPAVHKSDTRQPRVGRNKPQWDDRRSSRNNERDNKPQWYDRRSLRSPGRDEMQRNTARNYASQRPPDVRSFTCRQSYEKYDGF